MKPSRSISRRFDSIRPTESGLALQRDCLQPAEDFLDSLPFPLAHLVAFVPGGSRIDGASPVRGVLGHVRSGPQAAHRRNESRRVVAAVPAQGYALACRLLLDHRSSGVPLCRSGCQREPRVHHQAVAVLCDHMPQIAEPGFRPPAFLE